MSAGLPLGVRLRVLLIEDSALIRRSLIDALHVSDHVRVSAWAETADVALRLLGSAAPGRASAGPDPNSSSARAGKDAALTSSPASGAVPDTPFDAVIVDLQLKRGSGIEVLAYLQRSGLIGTTLAIVLTNYALPAYRQRCHAYGVQHVFDKSLEFDRVIEVLERHALDRSAAARRGAITPVSGSMR